MANYQARIAGWQVFLTALRSNNTTLVSTMAGVSLNTISAQNITDINAAIAAISAATAVANASLTTPD